MGNPLMQLHLTFVKFKGLCQDHSYFKSLYLIKELRYETIYGEFTDTLT